MPGYPALMWLTATANRAGEKPQKYEGGRAVATMVRFIEEHSSFREQLQVGDRRVGGRACGGP